MESSLIPRPRSLTDAKRRAEENAREAERRTSARNNDNSTIGARGKLAVTGDVNVADGGSINLASGGGVNVATGGAIRVAGTFKTAQASTPVDGSAVIGTDADPDTGAKSPGLFYTDAGAVKYGVRFKSGALVLDSSALAPAPNPTSTDVGKIFQDAIGRITCYANYLTMFTGFGSQSSQLTVAPAYIKLDTGAHNLVINSSGVLVDGAPIGQPPSYHAEYTSTVAGVPTNAGTLNLAAEPQSSNAATICTVVGSGQIRVNVAGDYSIDWYGYHGGTEAGINSYMNIVSSHRAIRLSSIDIPSNSGSSALAIGSIYLPANAILTFNCNFGNSQPNFQSFITIHKKR